MSEVKELTLREIEKMLGYKVKIVEEKPIEVGGLVDIADIEWIVLDKDEEGNLFCLTRDLVYKNIQFDNVTNNYTESNARKKLTSDLLKKITRYTGVNMLIDFKVDLTSDDGLTDYGTTTEKISLLTADMYRKYNLIIEKYPVEDWWYLATPWSTAHRGCRSNLRTVNTDGTLENHDCFCNYNDGLRPACLFSAALFETQGN